MCMSEPYHPVDPLRAILPVGHLLRTLADEHEELRGLLNKLEDVSLAIEGRGKVSPEDVLDVMCLLHYVRRLADALTSQEETVLFAALEARGVDSVTSQLRGEHVQLELLRERLLETANGALDDPEKRLDQLQTELRTFLTLMRSHLTREDERLLPFALEVIEDDASWSSLALQAWPGV